VGDLVAAGLEFLPGLFESAAPAAEAVAPAVEAAGPTAFGTATDFLGQGTFDALSAGTGVGPSAFDAAGTALAFPDLVGPGAGVGFGTSADAALTSAATTGLATGTSAIPGATSGLEAFLNATPTTGFGTTGVTSAPTSSSQLPSNVSNANAKASVFDTGTSPLTGTGPSAQPAAVSASNISAPSGVATTPDPTAVASGQVPGATGPTSVNGAPLQAPGTPTASVSSMLDKLSPSNLATSAIDSVTKNPISTALGVTGLGYNIIKGQQDTKNQAALKADAVTATANSNKMVADGEALQTYLTSGTLPPQYMQQVDNAINDAKTRAISNAAAQGLPTDPTKNTALATELAQIDNQRPGMISQVASQLFSSGSSLVNAGQNAAGLSADLYKSLVANDTTQAANIGKAITSLAQALNGKSGTSVPGTNLTVSSNP